MRTFLLLLSTFVVLMGCTPMQPALSTSNDPALVSFKVKGRQGWLINQKLTFGGYQTSRVKRSWTRGGNTRVGLPLRNVYDIYYPDLISLNYVNRDQSFYFQMMDVNGNLSDVYGSSRFASQDLQIGNNPNSVVNILEDIFGRNNYSENLFYLQLFLNDETRPWQLLLDNHAAQLHAKKYEGFFVFDRERYYTLRPITQIQGKKGPQNLLMGSVGFEIFNSRNESVAAVSLVNGGNVYFSTPNPDERFLLANLCAALLLQEDVSESETAYSNSTF